MLVKAALASDLTENNHRKRKNFSGKLVEASVKFQVPIA